MSISSNAEQLVYHALKFKIVDAVVKYSKANPDSLKSLAAEINKVKNYEDTFYFGLHLDNEEIQDSPGFPQLPDEIAKIITCCYRELSSSLAYNAVDGASKTIKGLLLLDFML